MQHVKIAIVNVFFKHSLIKMAVNTYRQKCFFMSEYLTNPQRYRQLISGQMI